MVENILGHFIYKSILLIQSPISLITAIKVLASGVFLFRIKNWKRFNSDFVTLNKKTWKSTTVLLYS